MKLDIECVRDVLIYIEENLEYNSTLTLSSIYDELAPRYQKNQIDYTCIKLLEGNYMNLITKNVEGKVLPLAVSSLTFDGHQFLEKIRNPKVWNPTKRFAKNLGSISIQTLSQISSDIIAKMITQNMNG